MMGTLIVFDSKDGESWGRYLGALLHERNQLKEHDFEYKAHDTFKRDDARSSTEEKEERQVLIIIITPVLLHHMIDNPSCSFEHIVKSPCDTLLIFCSVTEYEIVPHKHWFPAYDSMQKLVLTGTDENVISVLDHLAQFIVNPTERTQVVEKPPIRPRKSHPTPSQSRGSSPASNANSRTSSPCRSKPTKCERSDRQSDFSMFPCKCRCDERTDVVIIFKHRVAKSDYIEVERRDGPKEITSLRVFRHNPCTFQFTFRSNRSGLHELSVKKNDVLLGTKMFEVYGSPADPSEIRGVSLIYLALMDSIYKVYNRILTSDSCNQASIHPNVSRQSSASSLSSSSSSSAQTGLLGRAHSALDYELSHVLRDHTYIPDSFNLFSGCIPGGSSSHEFPTLLHFAAHYGLQEMVAALIDHNNARIACSIHDHAGATPIDLARHAGHEHIASLLDEFIKTSLQGESIYMAMEQYYYSQGDEEDQNDSNEQDAYSVCSGASGKIKDDHSASILHRDDSIYDEVQNQEEEDPYKELDDIKTDVTRNSGSTLVPSSGSSSATTINSQQSSPVGHADGAVECCENLEENMATAELPLGPMVFRPGSTASQVYLPMGFGETSTDDAELDAELHSITQAAGDMSLYEAASEVSQKSNSDTYALADDFKSGKKTPEPFKEDELFNYTTTKEISDLRTGRFRAERKDSVGSLGSMGSEDGAALTTFVQCPSQQELMDIMNMVKHQEITIEQAEEMFQKWQEQHQATRSASFKEKQEQLKKLQEEYNRVQRNIASQRRSTLKDIFTRRISSHKHKESKKKIGTPIPVVPVGASPRLARQSDYDLASDRGSPSRKNSETLERRPLPPVPTETSSPPVACSKITLQDSKRFSTVSTSSSASNSSCGSAASAASAASCQDSGVESTNYDDASGGGDKESGDEHLHVMTTPERYLSRPEYESLENSGKRTDVQDYDPAKRPLPSIPAEEEAISQDALEGRPMLPRPKTHFSHRPLPPLPKEDEPSPSSSPSPSTRVTPPRKTVPIPKTRKPALPKKPVLHSKPSLSPQQRANYCNVVVGIESSPLFLKKRESGQGSEKLPEAPPPLPPR